MSENKAGRFLASLLFGCVVLTSGCGKEPAKAPRSDQQSQEKAKDEKTKETKVVFPADLLKIQPKTRFKLASFKKGFHPWQLSHDGRRLAVDIYDAVENRRMEIWDLSAAPAKISEFNKDDLSFGSFRLSPSGKKLAVSLDTTTNVFDTESKKAVEIRGTSKSSLDDFTHGYFRDDDVFVSTIRDSSDWKNKRKGRVRVWNVSSKADAGSFEIPDSRIHDGVPTKQGKEFWLFVGGEEKYEIECYDLADKKLTRTIKYEPDEPKKSYSNPSDCSITSDGSAFTCKIGKTLLFDAKTGKVAGILPRGLFGTSTGFLPGGSYYLAHPYNDDDTKKAGLSSYNLIIYDWKGEKVLAALTGEFAEHRAAVSGDGMTLAGVTKEGEVMIFDISPVSAGKKN